MDNLNENIDPGTQPEGTRYNTQFLLRVVTTLIGVSLIIWGLVEYLT